jgi:nucleotide-binding universal stress UspA family protein
MKEVKFLVPHDFTNVGQKALDYAIHLSKKIEAEIQIVHLVANQRHVDSTLDKLNQVIADLPVYANVDYKAVAEVGDIFTDIGKMAEREGAQIVIMGTHGARGMQKVFGSFAMKVIESSSVPFLIVQTDTVIEDLKNIAVYINSGSESMQIMKIAAYIGSITGAKLNVIYEKVYDVAFRHRLNIHKEIIRESYEGMGLNFELIEMEEEKNAYNSITNFLDKNHCELIAAANYSEALIKQFDTFSQNLITNKNLTPCLMINAVSASQAYF